MPLYLLENWAFDLKTSLLMEFKLEANFSKTFISKLLKVYKCHIQPLLRPRDSTLQAGFSQPHTL